MRNDSSYFLDDFDWEAFEAQESSATISKQCQSEEYNLLNRAELHDIVDAEVVSVGKNEVVVKTGLENFEDSIISASEFIYYPNLKVGDIVPVYIENIDRENNHLTLSHKFAHLCRVRTSIYNAMNAKQMIRCQIAKLSEDGLIVDISGIEAILPHFLLDNNKEKCSHLIGKVINVYVLKIFEKSNKIIVSQKPFSDNINLSEYEKQEDENLCEDEKDISKNDELENYPGISEMVYTYGQMWPCPHCGSRDVQTYVDGTAKCRNCKKWYCYEY